MIIDFRAEIFLFFSETKIETSPEPKNLFLTSSIKLIGNLFSRLDLLLHSCPKPSVSSIA